MRLNTRPTTVTVCVAAALIALAGCGSDDGEGTDTTSTSSSSSSSATASSTSTSTTENNPDGATAIEVVKNFEKTTDDLQLDPMKETGALGAYATGQAYKQRTFTIRQSREAGKKYQGRGKVSKLKATKKSATRQQVTACIDLTDRKITDVDGNNVPLDFPRYEQHYTVDKSDGAQQDGKWRVTAERTTTAC